MAKPSLSDKYNALYREGVSVLDGKAEHIWEILNEKGYPPLVEPISRREEPLVLAEMTPELRREWAAQDMPAFTRAAEALRALGRGEEE